MVHAFELAHAERVQLVRIEVVKHAPHIGFALKLQLVELLVKMLNPLRQLVELTCPRRERAAPRFGLAA